MADADKIKIINAYFRDAANLKSLRKSPFYGKLRTAVGIACNNKLKRGVFDKFNGISLFGPFYVVAHKAASSEYIVSISDAIPGYKLPETYTGCCEVSAKSIDSSKNASNITARLLKNMLLEVDTLLFEGYSEKTLKYITSEAFSMKIKNILYPAEGILTTNSSVKFSAMGIDFSISHKDGYKPRYNGWGKSKDDYDKDDDQIAQPYLKVETNNRATRHIYLSNVDEFIGIIQESARVTMWLHDLYQEILK